MLEVMHEIIFVFISVAELLTDLGISQIFHCQWCGSNMIPCILTMRSREAELKCACQGGQ